MTDSLAYQRMGTADRNQAHALFSQTMGYVAITGLLGVFGLRRHRPGDGLGPATIRSGITRGLRPGR